MNFKIQARDFELTEALENYTLWRIRRSLGTQLDRVRSLRIGLSNGDGQSNVAGKRCQVYIALPQQRDVVVEDVQEDMYDAINSALHRARQALRRRLSKVRTRSQRAASKRARLVPAQPEAA